jgi:4'-phosphopantetheinyl transferase EntD
VRYLQRVSSANERNWVRSWARPDLALSVLWAAKEAAYKALSHPRVEEAFIPAEVSVNWEGSDLEGRCDWRGRSARVQGRIDEDHACAIALRAGTVSYAWNVSRIGEARSLTPAEESMAARGLAAGLLERAGYSNAEIRRAENGKPWIYGIDRVSVSLSHHGRWAAAAIAVEGIVPGEAA